MEFEDSPDAVGCVIELYKRNSNVTKTRQAVSTKNKLTINFFLNKCAH
jgi:hypothetical protein